MSPIPLDTYLFFFYGMLSVLSPCTLPIYPFIIRNMIHGRTLRESIEHSVIFVAALALTYALVSFLGINALKFMGLDVRVLKFAGGIFLLVLAFWLFGSRLPFIGQLEMPRKKKKETLFFAARPPTFYESILSGLTLGIVFTSCTFPLALSAFTIHMARQGVVMEWGALSLFLASASLLFALGMGTTILAVSALGKWIAGKQSFFRAAHWVYLIAAAVLFLYALLLIYDTVFFTNFSSFNFGNCPDCQPLPFS